MNRNTLYAAVIAVLEAVGFPAAILDATGAILAASTALADCAPAIDVDDSRRLTFDDETNQTTFEQTIARHGRGKVELAANSFPLVETKDHVPAVAHLLPMKQSAGVLLPGAGFLFYVTPLSRRSGLSIDQLRILFNLTPAEARVTKLISEGKSVAEAAAELDVQENTIRVQLKSVFAKTGTRRQAELMNLLIMPLPPTPNTPEPSA